MHDADVTSLRSWQWWVKNPAVGLLGLYVAGFVAQNSYLAGFRFVSSDLLDKNYIIGGLLCFAVLGFTWLFCFNGLDKPLYLSESLDVDIPTARTKIVKIVDIYAALTFYSFNLTVAASVLGGVTVHGLVGITTAIWTWIAIAELNISNRKWKVAIVYIGRALGIGLFATYHLASHAAELGIVMLAALNLAILRPMLSSDKHLQFGVMPAVLLLLVFCGAYGTGVHPLVKYEYGGGEPKNFFIRYQDEQSVGPRERNYVTVEAPMVYASDTIVYIKRDDGIHFIRREKIVSIEPSPRK